MAQSHHASVLELNCLVLGDDTSHVFTVKIPNNDNVSALKKAIWTEKTPVFGDIPADQLVLWKVSFPDDENLQQTLDKLELSEGDALRRSSARLSKVFPTRPEDEHLHILVKRPPARESSSAALRSLPLSIVCNSLSP
jgi:hypothetical protein